MRIHPQVFLSLELETVLLLCSLYRGTSMAEGHCLEAWSLEGMAQGDHESGTRLAHHQTVPLGTQGLWSNTPHLPAHPPTNLSMSLVSLLKLMWLRLKPDQRIK